MNTLLLQHFAFRWANELLFRQLSFTTKCLQTLFDLMPFSVWFSDLIGSCLVFAMKIRVFGSFVASRYVALKSYVRKTEVVLFWWVYKGKSVDFFQNTGKKNLSEKFIPYKALSTMCTKNSWKVLSWERQR